MSVDTIDSGDKWTPPAVDPKKMQYRVASSLVAQFAGGHDFSAVLRELVQNEYDAGGSKLEVEFHADALLIRGTGQSIDDKGWARLSVMIGTGNIPGTESRVEPKANGIGSKNFGLRSLFLIGDTIHIRSGGRSNSLDWRYGTYEKPHLDPTSLHKEGVEILVPFRREPSPHLPAFDPDREAEALNELARGLAPTLMKLAVPGKRKSLERVHVRSQRHRRELVWYQTARLETCRLRNTHALRRTIKLTDNGGTNSALTELEFMRSVRVPVEFQGNNLPGYFVRPQGRISIAVSFRTQGGRLQLNEMGRWFYPIGVDGEMTGNALSVCAPFDMDSDRSAIISVAVSDWNKWLVGQAVDLTVDLLRADWHKRFGADAFVALWPASHDHQSVFSEMLRERLRSEQVWPTRTKGRKLRLAVATELVVPSETVLDGFLEDKRYPPSDFLQDKGFRDVVHEAGAKVFGINSLVRLRCGPESVSLSTKLEKDAAHFFYPNYEKMLSDIELQIKFANALDRVERHLSNDNRKDLRLTPSTLSASHELRPGEDLQLVPQELSIACPLPPRDRLHPALALLESRVIRQSTNRFDANQWALETCRRIAEGHATEEERKALYAYICTKRGRLPRPLLASIRKAPVILDSRNQWVSPLTVLMSRTPGAADFGDRLRFPHPDVEQYPDLVRALRIRDRFSGNDLVALAKRVAEDPSHVGRFEALLVSQRRLLAPTVLRELTDIPFLRSSLGDLRAPGEMYINNTVNRSSLRDSVAYYVGGLPPSLAVKLGCHNVPQAQDILSFLDSLVADNTAPTGVETLYPELIRALSREGVDPLTLRERQIIWTDVGWAKPIDTVLGQVRLPAGSLPRPTLRAPAVITAYKRLGAAQVPQVHHWRAVLIWSGQRFGSTPIPAEVRAAVRNAYVQLGSEPGELPEGVPLLLNRSGRLYPISEARAGTFLIDDDPAIAVALSAVGSTYSFADVEEPRTYRFFTAAGVLSLRSIRSFVRFESKGERSGPSRFRQDEVLARLHSPNLPHALASLVSHRLRRSSDIRLPKAGDLAKLFASVKHLVFVHEIREDYRVGMQIVSIAARARHNGDSVLLAGVRGQSDALSLIAEIVAGWLPQDEQSEWADAVFRLLSADHVEEMVRYLGTRGVAWRPRQGAEADTEDEVTEAVSEIFGDLLTASRHSGDETVISPVRRPPGHTPPPVRPPLPDLSQVQPILKKVSGASVPPPSVRIGGSGGGFGGGQLRDEVRDRELGLRGEEIVLGIEQKRLRSVGIDEANAVWTAKDDPMADHDILSKDVDGRRLWIEVKATSGMGGRFRWSRAEFELALRVRKQYVLYRVYRADTLQPIVKAFHDPVALLVEDRIRLDLAVLHAEIEAAD